MMINATLIVQMIHFAIAYFVIDRILLRFVVHDIMVDEMREKTLQETMEQSTTRFRYLEKQKQTEWESLQEVFKKRSPEPFHEIVLNDQPLELAPQKIDESKLHQMRAQIAQTIVKKIGASHE